MFTGLIQTTGKILFTELNSSGKSFQIESLLPLDLKIGDSVAINGICLTVEMIQDKTFQVQAIHTTLEKTTIGSLSIGSMLNLELALKLHDKMGGHLVQGHVNGIGQITHLIKRGENWEIEIQIPEDLKKFCLSEGSIAIDGISLTIAKMTEAGIILSIIPHTWNVTNFAELKLGNFVNIEIDMMAKYIANFVDRYMQKLNNSNMTTN